jgi:hypothetical protein
VFWEIQQVLYLSIEYEERKEDFVLRATKAMNKVFEEYIVLDMKKYFEKYYSKLYGNVYYKL